MANKKLDDYLFQEIKTGNLKKIHYLIKIGADLNTSNFLGETPLFVATTFNQIDIAKLLILNQALVDKANFHNETPLMVAIQRENLDMIKMLCAFGANVDAKTSQHKTPLMFAAETGIFKERHKDIIEYIIKRSNFNVDLPDFDRRTALMYASQANNLEAIKILLTHYANIERRDTKGQTPLMYAINNHHLEATTLLLKQGANPNCEDNFGTTPLMLAPTDEIANIIQQYGGQVNPNTPKNLLLLNSKCYTVAQIALNKGASVNALTNDKKLIFNKKITQNHIGPIKAMIEYGIDVNFPCPTSHHTPLLVAVNHNKLEIATLLIKAKANVNEYNIVRGRLLEIAVQNNYKELTELLIQNGAQINAPQHSNILIYAQTDDMADLLLKHKASIRKEDLKELDDLFLDASSPKVAELFLQNGADINIKSPSSNTTKIIEECRKLNPNLDMIKMLLNHKANPNEIHKDYGSPLTLAAENDSKELIELLLSHKADINMQNSDGKTALHASINANSTKAIVCLLEHNANLNLRDVFGDSPLDIATDKQKELINQTLISLKENHKNFLKNSILPSRGGADFC